MLTVEEIAERMCTIWDIDDIMFTLKIETEELVDRFMDKIEDMQDELREELSDDNS